MKTTVEISNALFERSKAVAKRHNTTLRALVEEGLRQVVSQRERKSKFELRRATFKGTAEQIARRPGVSTNWHNLVLAGDWIDNGLPSTIEGSIRSGQTAAQRLLKSL